MGDNFIPSDWQGEYCCYAVMWPNSEAWQAILRGILTLPATGRFWNERTGTITEAQQVIRETFDTNLHLEEVIMACNDPNLAGIATALNNIAISLQAQATATATATGSCCETKGGGGSGVKPVPIGTTPQGDPQTDPPPNGWEDWETFLTDKCKMASYIVKSAQNDIGNLMIRIAAGLSLDGVAAIIALVVVTPIPFDDVVAISALLIGVGVEIVLATALDILNTNEQELMCELYLGEDASDSRAKFLTKFSSFVDSGVADPVENFAIKRFAEYWFDSDNLNRLYNLDTTLNLPAADCSNCGETIVIWDVCHEGPAEQDPPMTISVSSVEGCGNSYGCHTVLINVDSDSEGTMYGNHTYKIVASNLTGFTGGCYTYQSNPADFLYYDHTGALLSYDVVLDDRCANQFFMLSSTPFTVELTFEVCE